MSEVRTPALPDIKAPITVADMEEIKLLASSLHAPDQKAFVCSFCGNWNVLKEADIIDLMKPRKKKKKDIHMVLDEDLALTVNRLARNFGGYVPMMVYLMNELVKRKTS